MYLCQTCLPLIIIIHYYENLFLCNCFAIKTADAFSYYYKKIGSKKEIKDFLTCFA
jgi:hypothetical protein